MPRKQIVQFDAAVSIASTDRFLLQQGAAGTEFTHGTVTQLLNGGLAATYSSVTVNGATVPANGMYLPAANTLGFAANTTAEMQMTGTALSPATSDGLALGTTALMWSDAFLASGAVLNFNNGDVTVTHSADTLTVAGGGLSLTGAGTGLAVTNNATIGGTVITTGSETAAAFIPASATIPTNGMYLPTTNTLGWSVNTTAEMQLTGTALSAAVNGGLALGTTSLGWGSAHFATGAVLNFVNGDVTITHASNLLTMAGGGFTFKGTRVQGDFLVETSDPSYGAPGIRARGYRSDSNNSIDFGGQFFAEGVRTDALFASGKVFGGLIFGGNTDLTPTMGYTASITGVADAAWVDTANAATAIVFRTGVAAQARAANISYGTERGRITSGGRWLLGSATDDGSTAFQVNGNAKSTGYFLRSVGNALTATGSTRGDALQLANETNRLTTVASGTGVILPVGVVGMRIRIYQSGANPVKVYASASETIDGTAGSTGVTLTNALRCEYEFVAANTWISAQLGAVSA